tara:strand:- start:515 stop:1078 length:564 start_codon:yes stop_codon:yes gene_type:complete
MITAITACDPHAFADNMQRIPDLSYVMRSSNPWVPTSVMSEGMKVPAMRLTGGKHVDCSWSPLTGLNDDPSECKDLDAILTVVPFSTVRMKCESHSGPHVFADLKPEILGTVHLIAGYLRPTTEGGPSLGFFPHLIEPIPGRSAWVDREPLILSFGALCAWLSVNSEVLPKASNSEFKEVSVSLAMR